MIINLFALTHQHDWKKQSILLGRTLLEILLICGFVEDKVRPQAKVFDVKKEKLQNFKNCFEVEGNFFKKFNFINSDYAKLTINAEDLEILTKVILIAEENYTFQEKTATFELNSGILFDFNFSIGNFKNCAVLASIDEQLMTLFFKCSLELLFSGQNIGVLHLKKKQKNAQVKKTSLLIDELADFLQSSDKNEKKNQTMFLELVFKHEHSINKQLDISSVPFEMNSAQNRKLSQIFRNIIENNLLFTIKLLNKYRSASKIIHSSNFFTHPENLIDGIFKSKDQRNYLNEDNYRDLHVFYLNAGRNDLAKKMETLLDHKINFLAS